MTDALANLIWSYLESPHFQKTSQNITQDIYMPIKYLKGEHNLSQSEVTYPFKNW
jgi:hypothetical protein